MAEKLLIDLFDAFVSANPPVRHMAGRMLQLAGADMIRLVDHWVLPESEATRERLSSAGFEEIDSEGDRCWMAPNVRLARVRLEETKSEPTMALAVESIEAFEAAWGLTHSTRTGDIDSCLEEARYPQQVGQIAVVVRRGYSGFQPGRLGESELRRIRAIRQRLRSRPRAGTSLQVIEDAGELMREVIREVGEARAADELFSAEREYYMTRNAAARSQYARQCELGFGWANQDHHTYRSSRAAFRSLVALWRSLGFVCRERYYAGEDAGWGAQIMEHPVSRVVLFSDVDVAPDELDIDFAQCELPHRTAHGTIGLWCGLHSDSIAEAGMHHLECEYSFDAACAAMRAAGFDVMPPFTDLPLLKQAFTVGEIWEVSNERLEALRAAGSITQEQSQRFQAAGATGSHLEILQRREGFKGFNKTGVSAIIKATDARN